MAEATLVKDGRASDRETMRVRVRPTESELSDADLMTKPMRSDR